MSFFKRIFQRKNEVGLSVEDFGIELVNIARRGFPNYQYRLGETNVDQPYFWILSHENEEYSQVHYGDIYEGYIKNPTAKVAETVFADYAVNLQKLISGITLEVFVRKTDIMPVIKPISWVEAFAEKEGKSLAECSMISYPLDFGMKGDLCVAFVFDDGEHLIYVSKEMVPEFDPYIFIESVKCNVRDYLTRQIDNDTLKIETGLIGHIIRTDGEYEASLILIIDIVLELLQLEGTAIMGVLGQNVFVICDSTEHEKLLLLQEKAESIVKGLDSPLSPKLYVLTDDSKIELYEDRSKH